MASWVGTVAVVAHLIVMLLHGIAHSSLNIELSTWQKSYVALVIFSAPLVAAFLLWTRHVRVGLKLLIASMAGSLIFGLYYHYVAVSPDHVSHLPPGDAQALFRITALLLGLTETLALAMGLLYWQRMRAKT